MAEPVQPSPWIRTPHPNPGARLSLFCFPYAGGGASVFRGWANELPADVELRTVQPPGRENRLLEDPHTQLPDLIDDLAGAIEPYLDRPAVFFGHSMGSLIAFELAHRLRRDGLPTPQLLLVSGRRAPQIPNSEPPRHTLPNPEFMAELVRLNGTPPEVLADAELMALVLPTLRADFGLCHAYRYQKRPPLDCPIAAFGGLADAEASPADLAAWREQTRSGFSRQLFPGDHFYLNENRSALLQAIARHVQVLVRS